MLDAVQEDMQSHGRHEEYIQILVGNSEWERPYVGGKYLKVSLNSRTILSTLVKCRQHRYRFL
jgi:hypothetical protein